VTHNEDSLWHLLREVERMPFGAGQIAAVEEVIEHADAAGLRDLAFAARMLATNAYVQGGEPAKAFVTFSWCLADFDADPGRHDRAQALELLWHFKFAVRALTTFPDIPLDRTYAVLDDMERRYRDGGHSLYAVYSLRHLVARHIGDADAARHWYERWCVTPRDELSDCAGCDPTRKVRYLVSCGRDEEAIALAEPVFAGQATCLNQPQDILVALLVPYLRTGALDRAADAHRRAYRAHRQHLADLASIAEHVEFCARTGNEARGLEIVERHLDWLDRAPSPYAAMEFASAAALVLSRLAGAGQADAPVRRRGGEVSVAALGEELTRFATDLAARFDARNGTTHQSERIAQRLAAQPLVEYLPLSVTARRRVAAAPGGPPPGPKPAPVVIPDDAGPSELLDLAEEHFRQGRTAAAIEVWWAFDARHAEAELDARSAARRAEGRGHELVEDEDLAGAEAQWQRAAELFGEAGDEVRRQVALGKVGLARCVAGRPEAGADLVEQTTAYLVAQAPPDRRAGALSRLAVLRLIQERPEDALAVLDEAAAQAAQTDLTSLQVEIDLRRAECLGVLGRADELRDLAASVRERARAVDADVLSRAALVHGSVLSGDGQHAAAVDAFDEALSVASDPMVRLNARLYRARAQLELNRAAAAVDDLVEVVAECAQLGREEGGAFARFELAEAYRRAGRLTEAAEAGEEAVVALDRLGAQDEADRCRYFLADVYRELDEPELALGLLDTLATNLDGFDNLPARARMHEEAGDILYRLDRDAQAATRYAAAARAYGQAELRVDEVRAHRKRALALRWADRIDEALAALGEADALAARLPSDPARDPQAVWERAMLGYEGARLLAGVDRLTESVDRIEGVAAAFRSIDAYSEGVLAELLHGELLLRADRPAEAEPVLRAALGGLPPDADPVGHAAWLLATALDALGRADEARAVRAEYGVEEG
jgi:tetratricopeptide (TPR) repeat protein